MNGQADKQTGRARRQIDRETGRWTDKQTEDRRTDGLTDEQTDIKCFGLKIYYCVSLFCYYEFYTHDIINGRVIS